ncbi:MAG: sortase [Actinobacteria bacterium]|nr:sortase [Actinomycetota bacterium]
MDMSTKEKDEEEITPADEETFPEEAREAEDAQLEDELAAKEAAAENEAASVPPDDPTMYLSVPKLDISGATVVGGDAGLELGGQLVGGYPWQPVSNTYIAGHRLGFPGTGSDHIFYNLPSMAPGDEVVLTDSLGQTYTYQVSEILQVDPTDLGVLGPAGRDMVSLQTCIEDFGDFLSEGPNWNVRLVVRADRIA